MPSEEELINILQKSGLSKADINGKVKEQIEKMKGLINEETALFIIVKELGLDTNEHTKLSSSEKDLKIKDLKNSDGILRNVNVVGRITDISSLRSFNRKDGNKGYVSNFWIKDSTGEIRTVLWDDRAKYVEQDEFKINELVRILNGNLKKNRDGNLEIQVGNKGDIELNPSDVDYKDYPKLDSKQDKVNISEISIQMRKICVQGMIIDKGEIRTFNKKGTNEQISNQRIMIKDKTGSIPIIIWNDDIDKISKNNEGDTLLFDNLYAKPQYRNEEKLELNLSRNSTIKLVKKVDEKKAAQLSQVTSISKAIETEGIYNIHGEVIEVGDLKELTFKDGREGKLLSITLSDDTAAIRTTFWNEQADENIDLKIGDNIKLTKILTKMNNFSGMNEATFRRNSSIEKNIDLKLKKTFELPEKKSQGNLGRGNFTGNYIEIKDITSDGLVEIKGMIAKEITRITVYEACKVCRRKADNCKCSGGPKETEYKMILNLIIDDGTDTIRTSFIGNMAETLLNLEPIDVKMEIDGENAETFLKDISIQLLGRDLELVGRAKYSEYSSSYEIVVSNFRSIDPENEAKKILQEIES